MYTFTEQFCFKFADERENEEDLHIILYSFSDKNVHKMNLLFDIRQDKHSEGGFCLSFRNGFGMAESWGFIN